MPDTAQRLLVFVIGTRAQLIKVAPVVRACELRGLSCTLLMTGQHQETMQDLIDEFGITSAQVPAIEAAEHSTVRALVGWLPAAFRGVIKRLRELAIDASATDVLVHGDTLSTLLGAAAARRFGARVIHLESGLTSGKVWDPFPEEICRRLVFRMTDVAMCPNHAAVEYMKRYRRAKVVDTKGNTIIDAVAWALKSFGDEESVAPYVVASIHRFHNIYDAKRLNHLVETIESICSGFDVRFVLHPATRKRLQKENLLARLSANNKVQLLPRMGYSAFLRLAAGAACVLTDGGSNQEELAALGVPTIVMRSQTERPDGLGRNIVMEADVQGGVSEFLLGGKAASLRRTSQELGSFGPSQRIAQFLG